MASREGLGWLGRVPIDTVLVGLLDAVSKGDIPVGEDVKGIIKDGNGVEGGETEKSFPLLERYLETTSSKVWKDITTRIVEGIDKRKVDILDSIQNGTS